MFNEFSRYHPLTQCVFLIMSIILTSITTNPIYLFVSFLGALLYLILTKSIEITVKSTLRSLFFILIVASINPLFNHSGITPLWYFPNGNALTLESILIGIHYAILFFTIILWSKSAITLLSTDRILYIFGAFFSKLSVVISMIFRFTPYFIDKYKEIYQINLLSKSKLNSFFISFETIFLIALENSLEISQSMEFKGFSNKKRTHFHNFNFEKRDLLLITVILLLTFIVISFKYIYSFSFLPFIDSISMDNTGTIVLLMYTLLIFMPIFVNIGAIIQWKSSR